ncbi:MAG: hypothetical protein OZ922_00615 [Myxococcales bacterium]|nr:hypothetical protein [Myxococcales bacterium]
MRRGSVLVLAAMGVLAVANIGFAVDPPTGPPPIFGPDSSGDQLVFYYDARDGFTTFLTVRNRSIATKVVQVSFYGPEFANPPFTQTITLAGGGLHILDAGALHASGLPPRVGVAFATVIDGSGTGITSWALSGNFTVANLATGSAWGAPALARSAVHDDGTFPSPGSIIDNTVVSLPAICMPGLELAAYYDPDALAPSDDGGNQLIFLSFEDVAGTPLGVQSATTDWSVYGLRSNGSLLANTGFSGTGVVVTNLVTVLGADPSGSSGSILFESTPYCGRRTSLIFFAEALGTFGTGYLLPHYPLVF